MLASSALRSEVVMPLVPKMSEHELEEEVRKLKKELEKLRRQQTAFQEERDKLEDLPRRQLEAYRMVEERGMEGYGVWELAESRDISYPAARNLLESLRERQLVEEIWFPKGNRKKYRVLKKKD